MRKVFLDDLPKGGQHISNKYINWSKSIGSKVKFVYDDINGEIEIIDYISNKLFVKYLNNDIFKIRTGDFSGAQLGGILGSRTTIFKYQVDDIIDELKILECSRIGIDKGIHKIYKYICLLCGNTDYIRESQIIQNTRCNVCCNHPKKIIEGINDIPTVAPWMIEYFQGGYDEAKLYTKGSDKKIIFKCPDCGQLKPKRISQLNSNGLNCNKCGDGISMPNKIMFNILSQLDIEFEAEYGPDWIKPKRYDFYFKLNDKEYIVEMDGGFHYVDNNLTGDKFEESKAVDDYKDLKAKENHITLIRIDCNYKNNNDFNYIKQNISESDFSQLFNFSIVNWENAFIFSISSRIKEACQLWKEGFKSTIEISKIMKLSSTTILRYLKKGSKLNLCDYIVEYFQKNRGKKQCKQVICLNNKYIFDSINDAAKYIDKTGGTISAYLRGSTKYAGKHPITNEPLRWQYYSEYIKENPQLLTAK